VSHRLEVLTSTELNIRLRKAAQRSHLSKGEWVRRVLQESVYNSAKGSAISDPLARLESLGAPTADIEEMLSEIGAACRVHQH
jgi:hypothetical protein